MWEAREKEKHKSISMGWFHPQGRKMCEETNDYQDWEGQGPTGIQWVEATNAAKHPPMHKTGPQNKALPSPKCQFWDWEGLA